MQVITQGIAALMILLGLSIPIIVIAVIYYIKKRFEHKQIMAAIEKGTPLSELRPARRVSPPWIKNLTAGIALLIIAGGWFWMLRGNLVVGGRSWEILLGFILCSAGISLVIRALFQRKTQRRNLAIEKGIPLSEIERPNWITNFAVGIGSLALALTFFLILASGHVSQQNMVLFGIFLAIGLALFIRGLLLRKVQKQHLASDRSKSGPE